MDILLRKISDKIFNFPWLYKGLRILFLGGLPTSPLLRLLNSSITDDLLDVGCGTGFIAQKTVYKSYTGFDSDSKVIAIALKKRIPNASFSIASVQDFNFKNVTASKAVLYGILHHLDDATAKQLLRNLSACVSDAVVTLDSVYSKRHMINNLLCRLDRGRYVRTEEAWDKLLENTGFKVETRLIHYCNTKIAKYLSYRLTPLHRSKDKAGAA